MVSKEEIIEMVRKELAQIMESSPEDIDIHENFMKMGVSSIQAVKVINSIRKSLEIEISPAIIFEYQTIDALAEYVAAGEF